MPLRLPELLVLFVVALLIFGPKKLPEMGAAIGRSLTAFRKGWQEISDSTSEDAEIMERRAELKRLELEALDREIEAKKASLLAPVETAAAVATADVVTENIDAAIYQTSAEEYTETTTIPEAEVTYQVSNEEQSTAGETAVSEPQRTATGEATEKIPVLKREDEQEQNHAVS